MLHVYIFLIKLLEDNESSMYTAMLAQIQNVLVNYDAMDVSLFSNYSNFLNLLTSYYSVTLLLQSTFYNSRRNSNPC